MPVSCASCGTATSGAPGGKCPKCGDEPLPRLGKYRVLSRLGRGGMGEVYKAVHPALGTNVAIKVLRPVEGAAMTEGLVERFQREARIGARLRHPGLVAVHDIDREGDRFFMVMDYVEGRPLSDRLKEGTVPVREALGIAARVARALHAAHEQGVVHRDVKPANLLVEKDGTVRIVDFGLSFFRNDDQRITRTGAVLGTVLYMAPEQIVDRAKDLDARTDVYALGVVLYEMLAGVSPFAGATMYQTLKNIETRTPLPPSSRRAEVPVAVDAIVMKAISKNRDERYGTALKFAEALETRLPARASARPKRSLLWVGIAAGVVLAAFVAALLLTRRGPPAPETTEKPQEPSRPEKDKETFSPIEVRLREALALPAGSAEDLRRRREALVALAGGVSDDASPEDLYRRGEARLAYGDFRGAEADLERAAARGSDPAVRRRPFAWTFHHLLIPLTSGGEIVWLRIVSPDAAASLERGSPKDGPARDLYAACAALGRLRTQEAVSLWNAAQDGSPEATAGYALALWLNQEAPRARSVVEEAIVRHPGSLPLLLLDLILHGDRPGWEQEYARIEEAFSPEVPERYLVSASVGYYQAEPDRVAAQLRQAAAKGAADRAAIWEASMLLYLRGIYYFREGTSPAEAERLLRALEKVDARAHPAVHAPRVLLNLARRDRAGWEAALRGMPHDYPDSHLQYWRRASAAKSPARDYCRGFSQMLIADLNGARESFRAFVDVARTLPVPEMKDKDVPWYVGVAREGLAVLAVVRGDPKEAADHLIPIFREGDVTPEFGDWAAAVAEDATRRKALQEVFRDVASRLLAEDLPDRAVVALRHARRWGVSWERLNDDRAFEPLRLREDFRGLKGG